MKKKTLAVLLGMLFALSGMSNVMAEETSKVRNIIYMIPDGGGMEPFYLADALKQAGGWNREVYPYSTITEQEEMYSKKYLVGAVTTNSANSDVTDSAAAGTALSSGYKTNNSYIGVDTDKRPHANILEAAQFVGKKVGMFSTYEWTNATPASFSAHETERGNYAPMSQQIVNQGLDVVLGGGFGAAKWGDISEAKIRGYDIINTKSDLEKVKHGDRIWGNIVSGAFPFDIENTEDMPNIAEMTKAAITALDEEEGNGFFLMVEGSRIDGGGHSNYTNGMVGDFLAFDEACKVALKYAEGRNDTIVIIVPDHDTGGMILPDDIASAVEELKSGKEPENIKWETANHTSRYGGLFMYVPKGIAYPEGISGENMGTHTAYERNVVDNTILAPYLAKTMGISLDELTIDLFVDITDMGTYDDKLDLFSFSDYPVSVQSNVSYAYVGSDVADLNGQVTLLIDGRFYAPQILLDIAQGKVQYKKINYIYPIESSMSMYIPDTTDIEKWNARIEVHNFLPEAELNGKIVFTYPQSFVDLGGFDINAEEHNSTIEFECPRFDINDMELEFMYDFISDNGNKYSFRTKFKGLAYAGYANDDVKIDGIIDEPVWNNGIVMTCNDASRIVMIEDWKGDRDLSADFSVLWDEEFFYMYSVVTDEIFLPDRNVSKLWKGDSVQFGIFHDTEDDLIKGTAGENFEEIGIACIDGKPAAYRFLSQNGMTEIGEILPGEGFELACARNGDDITYEMKFKWSEMLGHDYIPQTGGVLGFSALINDNDGNGRRGWMEYGSGIGMTKDVNQFVVMPLLDFTEKNNEIQIYINGKKTETDVAPIIKDDRVFVPVRVIFEGIGAKVGWDEENKKVISELDSAIVVMAIGEKEIILNGEKKEVDVPPQIINNRTFLSINDISKIYNCDVIWDHVAKTVVVRQ